MATDYDNEATFSAEMLNLSAAACSSQPLQEGLDGPVVGLGFTRLHAAVQTGDRAQVECALAGASAADLNARDNVCRTPLLLAAAGRAPKLMQLLLERGANPSIPDGGGRTPLHMAAWKGCLQSVQLLRRRDDVQVSARDANGLTPLGMARSAACMHELAAAGGALSPDDLPLLLRDRPDMLSQLLDLGVQRDSAGVLRVTYRPLRDVGRDCPFEAELVSRVHRSGRWELLGHPAMELLLEVTRQDTLWMAVTSLVFSVTFLALLCVVVLFDVYHVQERSNETLKMVLVTFNCVRILVQLVKLPFTGTHVFKKLRFWPRVTTTVLTFLVAFLTHTEATRAVHAAAILSGFLELTLVVESIPTWRATKTISSLLYVTRRIIGYLLTYLPILLGFGLAFFVMLKKGEVKREDNVFRGDVLTMTIAAMVIGNVDVTQVNDHAPVMWGGFIVCNIIFILFLVMVPLVMLNMLLAMTITDTNKFLKEGSYEYLHHVANMTSMNQRTAFSLDRRLQTLHNKLPGWLFSCVSSLMLCVKWRSALPRQFEADGSFVKLVVNPVESDGKTVYVTAGGSKRKCRVSMILRDKLDQIVKKRVDAEAGGTEADPPLSGQDSAHSEVLQALTGQLRATQEMQEKMAQQLNAMREEMVKQLDTITERLAKSV